MNLFATPSLVSLTGLALLAGLLARPQDAGAGQNLPVDAF